MTVYHLNPDDPTSDYYATTTGASVEDRIAATKGWDDFPETVKQAWKAEWEKDQGTEEVVEASIENITKLSDFLSDLSAREKPTREARAAMVAAFLKKPLAKLNEEALPTKKNKTKKIDAIDAAQEAVGTSYANIAGWLEDGEVKDELTRRQANKGK